MERVNVELGLLGKWKNDTMYRPERPSLQSSDEKHNRKLSVPTMEKLGFMTQGSQLVRLPVRFDW